MIVSTSFGCPYEGDVDPRRVAGIVDRVVADGADRVAFGDTTGMATPRRVRELVTAVREPHAGRAGAAALPQHPGYRRWPTC